MQRLAGELFQGAHMIAVSDGLRVRSELQRYLSVSILGREGQVQTQVFSSFLSGAKKGVEAWSHVRLEGMRLRVTAITS
jgi:hypothetical protein